MPKHSTASIDINKTNLDKLKPGEKMYRVWDRRLSGFGVRISPTGRKTFILIYRDGAGGRSGKNKTYTIGSTGNLTCARARQLAQEKLGQVAKGESPQAEKLQQRAMPTVLEMFETYVSLRKLKPRTLKAYQDEMNWHLKDWFGRRIDAISHQEIHLRFSEITKYTGGSSANRTMSLLRSCYRAPCVEFNRLRNPVDLWLQGGGHYHRKKRRQIKNPTDVLPKWRTGILAVDMTDVVKDAIWFGLYTGMRRQEIISLRWQEVHDDHMFIEDTKTGVPLEFPLTRQLRDILARRREETASEWVFESPVKKGQHLGEFHARYEAISKQGGEKFWFHGLRNNFISIATRNLEYPESMTKRLVNHARSSDVTEGYAAEWTMEQLRTAAQAINDEIDRLMMGEPAGV